jgi:hypothetical protein
MDFELDHLFICVDEGGPEAEQLQALGLTEGPPNIHPGQGTANRRFFFDNTMLELVWVTNPAEAQGEMAGPLQLWERWSGRQGGACPFGVCLRPARAGVEGLPFAAWPYRPTYLPDPLCLHIATTCSSPRVPLLFYFPLYRRPQEQSAPIDGARQHPLGVRQITRVLVHGPTPPALEDPTAMGIVQFPRADHHLMEVGFDGETAGRHADLRPTLPLILRW